MLIHLEVFSMLIDFMFVFVQQDAGYGEKSLFSCGEDDNDDPENKVDDEVSAPCLPMFNSPLTNNINYIWSDSNLSVYNFLNVIVKV